MGLSRIIGLHLTLGEVVGGNIIAKKMQAASLALEELLVAARDQDCLTMGIYESAKYMNAEPDSVVLCVLAADGEDAEDVALQIHFTLLRAFCCDSGTAILRVTGVPRLEQLLGQPVATDTNGNPAPATAADGDGDERQDLHCILVTNPQVQHSRLQEVGTYCRASRSLDQWVPEITLQER